jgi:hypothetical protein
MLVFLHVTVLGNTTHAETLRWHPDGMRYISLTLSNLPGVINGPSGGALNALVFFQLITECRFKRRVSHQGR